MSAFGRRRAQQLAAISSEPSDNVSGPAFRLVGLEGAGPPGCLVRDSRAQTNRERHTRQALEWSGDKGLLVLDDTPFFRCQPKIGGSAARRIALMILRRLNRIGDDDKPLLRTRHLLVGEGYLGPPGCSADRLDGVGTCKDVWMAGQDHQDVVGDDGLVAGRVGRPEALLRAPKACVIQGRILHRGC